MSLDRDERERERSTKNAPSGLDVTHITVSADNCLAECPCLPSLP